MTERENYLRTKTRGLLLQLRYLPDTKESRDIITKAITQISQNGKEINELNEDNFIGKVHFTDLNNGTGILKEAMNSELDFQALVEDATRTFLLGAFDDIDLEGSLILIDDITEDEENHPTRKLFFSDNIYPLFRGTSCPYCDHPTPSSKINAFNIRSRRDPKIRYQIQETCCPEFLILMQNYLADEKIFKHFK